jgi:isoleucyl-tRNA synthetase
VIVSQDRFQKVAETYRLLRNTLRYQLSNLFDFEPARHTAPNEQLTGLDRWILDAFGRLQADVLQAYEQYEFHLVYQRISQFAAVELSSIYHDVVKDRLYTDPPDSSRRRATQTTLHTLVNGLCRMLAPILAFTADEAWEFVPDREREWVHLLEWRPQRFQRDDEEIHAWKQLFALRDIALPELERARQAKLIGKALEAKLEIAGPSRQVGAAVEHSEALRELLNVSQIRLTSDDSLDAVSIQVARADGSKCGRCWHWKSDVGESKAHPTLCGRCVAAITAYQAQPATP